MLLKGIGICVLLSVWTSAYKFKSFHQILAWRELEWGFPTPEDRRHAINNGILIENAGTPIDVGVEYFRNRSARTFITIPRFVDGIPYTLATVSEQFSSNGPVINAYPSYKLHDSNNTKCTGIISAFRVAIDECNQMWVVDSGNIAGAQICPPQLLTIDLNTDRIIHRFQFTEDVYIPSASLFITPAVDIRDPPPGGRCQNAMVYIADVDRPGLVVYNSQDQAAWRIENKWMYPDPDWGTHTIANESFDLMDGIFAVNVSPRNKRGGQTINRNLYFHALASDAEISVPLRFIDNRTIWQDNPQALPSIFKVLGRRYVQSAMEAMDSQGNLFANTYDPLKVFAWNIRSPYRRWSFKVVADDPKQLQFASGMKVVRNPKNEEELWMLTCRLQKFMRGTRNPKEINFRILTCKTADLLNDRKCRIS